MNAKFAGCAMVAVLAMVVLAGHGMADTANRIATQHAAAEQRAMGCASNPHCDDPAAINGGAAQ